MKNLSIAFLAAVSLASFAGCKKGGGGSTGEAIAKLTEFKDKMCKCTDKACAEQVSGEMTKWGQEQAKSADKAAKVSEEDTKKMAAVSQEMTQCMTKAMMGGAAMTPPPGDKPADPAAAPAGDKPADPAAAPAAPAGDKPADPAAAGSAAPAAGGEKPAGGGW